MLIVTDIYIHKGSETKSLVNNVRLYVSNLTTFKKDFIKILEKKHGRRIKEQTKKYTNTNFDLSLTYIEK